MGPFEGARAWIRVIPGNFYTNEEPLELGPPDGRKMSGASSSADTLEDTGRSSFWPGGRKNITLCPLRRSSSTRANGAEHGRRSSATKVFSGLSECSEKTQEEHQPEVRYLGLEALEFRCSAAQNRFRRLNWRPAASTFINASVFRRTPRRPLRLGLNFKPCRPGDTRLGLHGRRDTWNLPWRQHYHAGAVETVHRLQAWIAASRQTTLTRGHDTGTNDLEHQLP